MNEDDDDDDLELYTANGEYLPSAPLLTQLEQLRFHRDGKQRAWPLIAQAVSNPDGFGVLDFALEYEFVESLDGQPAQYWTNPLDGSEMVWIPGGQFYYGEDDCRGTLPGFSLARYPVTNRQFEQFLTATNYQPSSNESTLQRDLFLAHWGTGAPTPTNLQEHPVVYVSYLDARAYCRWAGLQLPTEWHWEKAARGVDGRHFPWGHHHPPRRDLANVFAYATTPVQQYKDVRSPYGCADLIGNVSEWCDATEDNRCDTPRLDPLPLLDYHQPTAGPYAILRGSCYLRRTLKRCLATHRRRLWIARRNHWTGFRPMLAAPVRPHQARP